MRVFRPWNSSTLQPLVAVDGFAVLARDGRVLVIEPEPATGAHAPVPDEAA